MPYLHDAIEDGNVEQIRWLLSRDADVNEPDSAGNTPLMLAMRQYCYESDIRRLLRRGADVQSRNHCGLTALCVALDYSTIEGAQQLLAYHKRRRERPRVDPLLERGRHALLLALLEGDVEAMQTCVEDGADPNARNSAGDTPLLVATKIGSAETVRLLLDLGADVNARESRGSGSTALHIAADEGHASCAQALLEHGSEVNPRDGQGRTPLMEVAFRSSAQTCRLLLEYGADVHATSDSGTTSLYLAAWLADEDVIRLLLDHGAGENAADLQRALHACVVDNNRDKARILIEAGAEVGLAEAIMLRDESRIRGMLEGDPEVPELNRALCAAASYANAAMVRELLDRGAEVNADCGGVSPLNRALYNLWESDPVFDTLLDAGANVNSRASHGETAFAAQCSGPFDEELLRRMVAMGADVNAADSFGWTPLIRAAWLKELRTVKFLLECGADVNRQDEEGRTALILAAEAGDARVANTLLKHGARADTQDNKGRTAHAVASRWVGRPIARLMGTPA